MGAKRLLTIDWAAAKAEYVNDTTITHQQLADKYHVKLGTVCARALREDWTNARAERGRILLDTVRKRTIADAAHELADYNEQDLQIAKRLREAVVAKLRNSQSARDIRSLAGAIESVQRVARLALGASTSNTLSSDATAMLGDVALEVLSDDELTAFQQLLVKAFDAGRSRNKAPGSEAIQ